MYLVLGLAGILLPIVGAILGKLITVTPTLRKIENDHENTVAGGLRHDMEILQEQHQRAVTALTERVTALETKLESAEETARKAVEEKGKTEAKLMVTVSAVTILSSELRRKDPENPALKTANDLITTALSGDLGLGRGFEAIANHPVIRGKA